MWQSCANSNNSMISQKDAASCPWRLALSVLGRSKKEPFETWRRALYEFTQHWWTDFDFTDTSEEGLQNDLRRDEAPRH